jgi:hypothetical protein
VTASLSSEQRAALAMVLAERPEVARAIFVTDGPKPVLAFEYDDRPESVEAARTAVQELVAAVAPALGDTARAIGFVAGGRDDLRSSAGGEVVYERR